MISSHFEKMVTTLLPAEEFRLFRRSDLKRLPQRTTNRFLRAAEAALRTPAAPASLADWLASPVEYDRRRTENRQALCALCLGEAVSQQGRYLGAAAECLFLLLSEPDWNRAGRRHVPAAGGMPDCFAAQTTELLCWAAVLLDRPLEEYAIGLRESAFAACEIRAIAWLDDPACCEAALRRTDAPQFARALVSACLLTPQDESTRWLRLKNALRILDRCTSGGWLSAAFGRSSLPGWMESACALADAVLLSDLACAGQSGLRSDESLLAEIRLPARLHIAGPCFADEKCALRPEFSGEDLYRIGAAFDDDGLCSLGAFLDAREQEAEAQQGMVLRPAENITSRMLNALWRPSLEQDGGQLNEDPLCCVPWLHFYAARPHGGKGFYAALLAGAPVLFLDGEPVIGLCNQQRSLPEIEGVRPTRCACRDESLRAEGFPTISMDIAPSFPPEASLASWQRTIMLTNQDQTVRLLDAFDFSGARKGCSLRFVCAQQPVVAVGAPRARIGAAHMEWDGPTRASVETIETGTGAQAWCLVLSRDESAAGGCWTCTFTRSKPAQE